MWIRFANRFTTGKLQFIEIDTVKFSDLAKQFKVNPNDGNQLPTLILLEDNTEVLRFPPINYKEGKVGKVVNFKEKELVKYFDLERRFMASAEEEKVEKKKARV